MYDLKMLEEIKSQEKRIHFSSFDHNDAYTLGTMLRERGLTTPKPIAIALFLMILSCISHSFREQMKATTSG